MFGLYNIAGIGLGGYFLYRYGISYIMEQYQETGGQLLWSYGKLVSKYQRLNRNYIIPTYKTYFHPVIKYIFNLKEKNITVVQNGKEIAYFESITEILNSDYKTLNNYDFILYKNGDKEPYNILRNIEFLRLADNIQESEIKFLSIILSVPEKYIYENEDDMEDYENEDSESDGSCSIHESENEDSESDGSCSIHESENEDSESDGSCSMHESENEDSESDGNCSIHESEDSESDGNCSIHESEDSESEYSGSGSEYSGSVSEYSGGVSEYSESECEEEELTREINLSIPYNFYIPENIVLDKAFIRWYCRKYIKWYLPSDSQYIIRMIDNNIESIELNEKQAILIKTDKYIILDKHKIKQYLYEDKKNLVLATGEDSQSENSNSESESDSDIEIRGLEEEEDKGPYGVNEDDIHNWGLIDLASNFFGWNYYNKEKIH